MSLCCVLEEDTFILAYPKTRPEITEKNVDWDIKNQIKSKLHSVQIFILSSFEHVNYNQMGNSVDPDQMALSEAI